MQFILQRILWMALSDCALTRQREKGFSERESESRELSGVSCKDTHPIIWAQPLQRI